MIEYLAEVRDAAAKQDGRTMDRSNHDRSAVALEAPTTWIVPRRTRLIKSIVGSNSGSRAARFWTQDSTTKGSASNLRRWLRVIERERTGEKNC